MVALAGLIPLAPEARSGSILELSAALGDRWPLGWRPGSGPAKSDNKQLPLDFRAARFLEGVPSLS